MTYSDSLNLVFYHIYVQNLIIMQKNSDMTKSHSLRVPLNPLTAMKNETKADLVSIMAKSQMGVMPLGPFPTSVT